MIPWQTAVDVFTCVADTAIVIFFIIELFGAKEDRLLQKKTIVVLEELTKVLSIKSTEQIEILEEVKEELADIADNTQISEGIEGQNESDFNRDIHGREITKPEPSCLP